jgi:ribosome-binding factor A
MHPRRYVRSQIGQRIRLRLTPEVRFEWDNSMEDYDALERALGADEMARCVAP